jgi:hypothetical protein
MSIDDLIVRLSAVPGARVGHGPRHPSSADLSVGPRVREFFEKFPALTSDRAYVEFQQKYAGASINNEERQQIDDIFGFTDASTNIIEMEGPIVDDNGFVVFAQCIFHQVVDGKLLDMYEYDFAFNVSGKLDPGIYRNYATLRTEPTAFTSCVSDFHSWLEGLVARNGYYERPPVD